MLLIIVGLGAACLCLIAALCKTAEEEDTELKRLRRERKLIRERRVMETYYEVQELEEEGEDWATIFDSADKDVALGEYAFQASTAFSTVRLVKVEVLKESSNGEHPNDA